ncbi:Glycyl-glycine endopeptidase ALE-1 precursor [Streptomyces sp. S4.7]|uniref:M23 family metallopeptidase n=1 Tax=Streptomyces sp. S4.7 TaxID=2705439 RepID=UPI001397F8A1|nr:M23 family metallopeptidase [Streptomyces sp. S4.7]QHY98637.1 Glycyl-glycine endopeptidase ALE-1 precursor [Streptomyces sp. S4.7]
MAFTRATGKHRAPGRMTRRSANIAGVATLTAAGVIGTLASPALAAEAGAALAQEAAPAAPDRAIVIDDSLAAKIDAQADAQRLAARKAAKAKAEAKAAARAKAEAKRKAQAREAEERAARAAERERLNAYRLPVAGSSVTTGYRTGGALWSSGSHSGVDFRATSGTSVVAVGAGTVVEAGWGGAYGNNVVIRMNDGTYTQYGHLSSVAVNVGQSVSPGTSVGLSGSTGNSTGPHLHFEARTSEEYGTDIDPVAYLRSHGVGV